MSIGFDSYQGTFYAHSDHLGSASWITDENGIPVQHMQYLPWGEVWMDERAMWYEERFTFSRRRGMRRLATLTLVIAITYHIMEFGEVLIR